MKILTQHLFSWEAGLPMGGMRDYSGPVESVEQAEEIMRDMDPVFGEDVEWRAHIADINEYSELVVTHTYTDGKFNEVEKRKE